MLALTHEDIDTEKKIINVNKSIKKMTYNGERIQVIKTPKTKNSIRVVPISDKLIPLIQRHIIFEKQKHLKIGVSFTQQSPFFSSAICGYREAGSVQESFKRLQKRLNTPYKKFHALRHTFCTLLFESGVPLKTASMLMGHADITTTAQIYTHVDLAEKEKAINKLSSLI